MNERIKELAEQATGKEYWSNVQNKYVRDFDKEKFAEMLVKKFDDILVLEYVDCIGNQDKQAEERIERLREKVKTYFGVEE
jgi:hypothetical protein